MKDLVIFGNTELARLLHYYLVEDNDPRQIVCFTINRDGIKETEFDGLPLVAFEDLEETYPHDQYDILLGIGNSHMNDTRKRIFNECKQKGYQIASFIHSSSKVHSKDIGEGNIMLEDCLVYPFASIGNGNLFWDHVLVSHDCKIGDFNTFSGSADMCGYVTVGDNGYFGKQCLLNDGIKVGDYVLIGACAYAKRNIRDYEVIVAPKSITVDNKKSTDLMYIASRLAGH